MDTYELEIKALEDSADNLAKYSQEMANQISSLRKILAYVVQNWENSEGSDISSINTNFDTCIQALETKIQPTIQELTVTLYNLASESRANQASTMSY